MGLLTSDLKYDQMRTVFMTEGSIDGERLDRDLAAAAAELRARASRRRRRPRRDRGRGRTRLPLRRPGLRAAGRAAGGAVHAGGARGVPPPARAGVRPCVPRPDRDRQPPRDGVRQAGADRAAAGERERRRRRSSARARASSAARLHATRYYERSLPPGRRVDRRRGGRLPARHDHRRPAGLDRRADAIRQPYPQPDERAGDRHPASTRSPRR